MSAFTLTHGPALVGVVPHLVGYWPDDSLVLVTASSTETGSGELGPSLRLDFGYRQADSMDADVVDAMLAPLGQTADVDVVFPVVFSEPVAAHHMRMDEVTVDAAAALTVLEALERVCEALDERGFTVVAPLWAGADSCGRVGEPGGSSLAEAERSPAVVAMIAEGSSVAAGFSECVRLPAPRPELAARLERLRRSGVSDEAAAGALLQEARRLDARARLREDDGERPEKLPAPDPRAIIALDRFMGRLADRDFVQMLLSGDHPAFTAAELDGVADADFLAYAREASAQPGAARSLVGFCPRPPRLWALAEAVDWLRACLPYVSEEAGAGTYAMLAWFEWSRVRMRFAEHYARIALSISEDYRLASLVLRAVRTGLPPLWAAPRDHPCRGR